MKKTGAWLVRHALEQVGVEFTFGIRGVHNTEIYEELNSSKQIRPILVTHEAGAAFMADAISRTSSSIGTIVIVPAAGVTHAASGIGEAFLDGIPMLVLSGSTRTDNERNYQLHEMDQQALLAPITKKTFKIETHEDIIPTIYEAYSIATAGEPGPVFIEIPVNLQIFSAEISEVPDYNPSNKKPVLDLKAIQQAAQELHDAKNPGLFLGWGAVHASAASMQIADLLNAPAATTLQGLSAFPANHALHTGMSFGKSSVPAAENAFKNCDCLLAVGTRFGEIATASYSIKVPKNLIHIDINPNVFNANYPAAITIEGDSKLILRELVRTLQSLGGPRSQDTPKKSIALKTAIKVHKDAYKEEWFNHDSKDRVNPARFFTELREQLDDTAVVIADDGNHTFLTAELMPINTPRSFISPTDFNCMGYCTPAVTAVKLAHPEKQVVGIVGDSAFLMTCMETLTASSLRVGGIYFVFNDGELSQKSQVSNLIRNHKTSTDLNAIEIRGIAIATGCEYISIDSDTTTRDGIVAALQFAEENKPVIVEVKIDYSKRTRFTKGVMKSNLNGFSLGYKARFIGRALIRHIKS